MMQAWADYPDGLKSGAEVIPMLKGRNKTVPFYATRSLGSRPLELKVDGDRGKGDL
jgi:hypothetical protein